jgi:hypothetical protein
LHINNIGNNILDRFAPQRGGNPDADAFLLALVRMGLGLIVAWRSFFIATDATYYFEESEWLGGTLVWESAAGWLFFGLGLMLAIGLWTRLVALLLMGGHAAFSIWTSTYNLGPMLMVPMFGGLAALNAGCVCSIDAWRGRCGLEPQWRDRQRVGLLLFAFNAVLHLSAVIFHLKDANWLAGKTVALLLTNSYMSRYYEFFRECEAVWPIGWQMASWLGVLIQTVFQLGMLPMVFFWWGRVFVIWYGAFFIVFSLFGIQISILPMVEALLWMWLFLPSAWLFKLLGKNVSEFRCNVTGGSAKGVWLFFWGYIGLMSIFTLNVLFTQVFDCPLPQWVRQYPLAYSGLIAPNVFNKDDLGMGDKWPVIYRIQGCELVKLPLNGVDGERLSWHQSDLLYYSNSLVWRRCAIGLQELEEFMDISAGVGGRLIQKLLRYDYRKTRAVGPVFYEVQIYVNRASAPEIGNISRYEPALIYKSIIKCDL